MVFVYIMGKIKTGKELEVFEQLNQVKQVEKTSLTYGVYDFCVEVSLQTMEELDEFVFNVLRKIPGITDTFTLVTSKTVSK